MSKLKLFFAAIGGFIALLVLCAVALPLFVDTDIYKPQLEAAASDALGMEVKIGGDIGIGIFPALSVTLADLRLRNRRAEIASVQEAGFGLDLLPLLRGDIRIQNIELKRPEITIEQKRDGRFNFENTQAAGADATPSLPNNIAISNGTLIYINRQSGEEFVARDCNLDLPYLRMSNREDMDMLKNLSFNAELDCREIKTKKFTILDLRASAEGNNGKFDLSPITMRVFGAQGQGSIHANYSGAIPRYRTRFSLPQFRMEELYNTLTPKKIVTGTMDFSVHLSMRGKTEYEIKRTLEGPVSLRGNGLVLSGVDLDVVFCRFESSQSFSLLDVGGVFIAGPFGLLFTKGYDFGSIFLDTGISSEIRTLVSDWEIKRGVARARDVAIATNKNRVALTGGLNFVNEQFKDVTIALIDAKGCTKMHQKIRGPFEKPIVEKPNIVETLAGSALGLLKKGRELLTGNTCEIFYSGSVAQPK